jgi:hypothetical protein
MVLTLAACGGGSSAAPTKQAYESALSRLCLVAADQLRELHLDTTVAAWRADGGKVVAIERNFNHKLAALKVPESIRAAVVAYTQANELTFRDAEAAVAAAKEGDAPRLRAALKRADGDGLATGAPAKAIGATGCYIG